MNSGFDLTRAMDLLRAREDADNTLLVVLGSRLGLLAEARERATRQAYEAQQSRIAKASADAAAARGHSRGGVVPKDYLDRNADEHESSFVDDESSESGR